MTAGRKSTSVAPIEKPTIDPAQAQADISAPLQSAELAAAFDETLELGKMVGRIEAADFYETVSHSVRLASYDLAKKSKAYKNLLNPKSETHFTNLEEFCQVHLECSYRRMDQIANNRATVGEGIFEKSERLGLRQKDYNAINALPADDKDLIKNAMAETNSREEIIDLLQEMALRNQKVKESLQQVIDGQTALLTDKDAVIVQKTAKIEELVEAKNRREALTGAELHAELERDLTEATLVATGTMMVLRARIDDIRCLDKLPQGLYVACANSLQRIVCEAMAIATDYGIQLTLAAELEGDDSFDDPNAGEDVNADWVEQVK